MKNVPLKELKEHLSQWAEEAAHGEVVQVTKHNRPYIILTPSGASGLYFGKKAGREPLKPALQNATGGRWIDYLKEDRQEDDR